MKPVETAADTRSARRTEVRWSPGRAPDIPRKYMR
jgi:hypothetical protein